MSEPFVWSEHAQRWRFPPPPDAVAAIDEVGHELGSDADIDAVIAALVARELSFLECMQGLVAIKAVTMPQAKQLVHRHHALAAGRKDREAFWAGLYDEITKELADRQRGPATDPVDRQAGRGGG
ncbi:hypothetical protein GCM10009682_34190 [Luedemannella flava]|uniref:Uncharacterized protein n=1 Tax=Luedemannella flava TaxID=349316 RepID=A0ABP4YEW3_9ACTN